MRLDTHTQRQRHRWREKQTPCKEPDTGLDPRTRGSQSEPNADVQPLSHPGIPHYISIVVICIYSENNRN